MEPSHTSTADHAPSALPPAANAASKEKHQRLFQRGLKCLGLGVLLMAVSFGINVLLFHSGQDFETTMYVLTTLGAVFIMFGLACLFGF